MCHFLIGEEHKQQKLRGKRKILFDTYQMLSGLESGRDELLVNKPTSSSKASAGKSQAGEAHNIKTFLVSYHVCSWLFKVGF